MQKQFCDRCKGEIKESYSTSELYIEMPEKPRGVCDIFLPNKKIHKDLCEKCVNDILNIIEYECDRFQSSLVITVSKEATENDV